MKNKVNQLAVICPVHEIVEDEKDFLIASYTSVINASQNSDIDISFYFVVPHAEIKTNIDSHISGVNYDFIINDSNDTSFQGQVNYAVNNITEDYFLILEFDDELTENWIKNVEEYYHESIDIYLPIIVSLNYQEERSINGLFNAYSWAEGLTEKMGVLDKDGLSKNMNFIISGAVINTNEFKKIGGLKSNIKLTFIYEFLLRSIYNGLKVYTVPKMGYKHLDLRPNSLFMRYRTEGDEMMLGENEGKKWLEIANQEFYFEEDREIMG